MTAGESARGAPESARHPGEGGAPPPRLIFWELTRRCNLRCRHCRAVPLAEASPEELSAAECLSVLDQIAGLGRPLVILTGGEPLVRPDLFEIARAARERDLYIALATNGTLVDGPLAGRIAAAEFRRVSVSLDGTRPETHDGLRGLPGSFERALAGLRALRAAGVKTQINFTLTRGNAEELSGVLDLGEREGAAAVHLFMLVPVGCGREIADDEMLSPERYEEILQALYGESRRRGIEIRATCAPHYSRIGRARAAADPIPPGPNAAQTRARGCIAGSAACFISHRGDVQGCGYLSVKAGSVREKSLRDIWENAELFRLLRDPSRLGGRCGACEFRAVCSGCRARAYAATGDVMAEEPFCAYVPRPMEGVR